MGWGEEGERCEFAGAWVGKMKGMGMGMGVDNVCARMYVSMDGWMDITAAE